MNAVAFHTCRGHALIDIKRGETLTLSPADLCAALAGPLTERERWAYECAANLLEMVTGDPVDDEGPTQMSLFEEDLPEPMNRNQPPPQQSSQ